MKRASHLVIGICVVLCLAGIVLKITVLKRMKQKEIPTFSSASNTISLPLQKDLNGEESNVAYQSNPVASQILALLASADPRDQDKAYELLKEWVRNDPHAAADFAESDAAAKWRPDLMVIVAQAWTDANVNDAEAWASQLSNPTERSMVLGYVTFEEANTDPSRAIQILGNSQMTDERRTVIVQNLATQLAEQDLQPIYNWLSSQPASAQRDDWFERVALAQARTAPAQAAAIVAEDIAPGSVQNDAALQVLRLWARQDMSAAMAWANEFPSGLQTKARQILAGNLAGAYQSF
jgi:hypothetical protein